MVKLMASLPMALALTTVSKITVPAALSEASLVPATAALCLSVRLVPASVMPGANSTLRPLLAVRLSSVVREPVKLMSAVAASVRIDTVFAPGAVCRPLAATFNVASLAR